MHLLSVFQLNWDYIVVAELMRPCGTTRTPRNDTFFFRIPSTNHFHTILLGHLCTKQLQRKYYFYAGVLWTVRQLFYALFYTLKCIIDMLWNPDVSEKTLLANLQRSLPGCDLQVASKPWQNVPKSKHDKKR